MRLQQQERDDAHITTRSKGWARLGGHCGVYVDDPLPTQAPRMERTEKLPPAQEEDRRGELEEQAERYGA